MRARLRLLPWMILFVAVVASAVDPRLLRRLSPDRGAPRMFYERGSPARQFELFLNQVAADTPRGSSIAIAVPVSEFGRDYAYPFYRGAYLLAGRRVIPLMDQDQSVHFERLREADFVAAWEVRPRGFVQMWTKGNGSLYRRVR